LRKLIFHIGLHKTGSTTIQDTLYWQREKGLKFGLHYPDITANLSRVLYTCFSEYGHTLRLNKLHGLDTPEKLRTPIETGLSTIQKKTSAIEEPKTIISAEGATRLPILDVQKLADWLSQFFDEIDVLAYVRPPRALLNSLFQQEIRSGERLDALAKDPPVIDYRARLQPYLDVFGDKVSLKIFSRDKLLKNCIVADILSQMGVDPALYEQLDIKRKNMSLSWPATLYLDAINSEIPIDIDGKPNKARQKHLITNARNISGEKFALPYEFLNSICAQQVEDIKWMEQQLGVKLDTYDLKPDGITDFSSFLQDQREQSFPTLARHLHDLQKKAES